jgi:hypothetical protein
MVISQQLNHFVTARSPLEISPALLMRRDRKQHDITLLRPFVFFLRAMPFSLMKPWHKLLLYFRTTWQLNMAERQAKHITLPRIFFPIRLQSVGHFHTGLDAAEPIGVLTYLVPATKNSTQNTSRESRTCRPRLWLPCSACSPRSRMALRKRTSAPFFVTVPGAIIKRFFRA